MLVHPDFNPIALELGPIQVRWYGLMYLLGFLTCYALARYRVKTGRSGPITAPIVEDLLFFVVLGVVVGGRLGYVLFYNLSYYLSHPLEIPMVWHGGMSFHGGFLGVLLAVWYVARKYKLRWLAVTDFVGPLIPPALGLGRLGNFINGELWGRVTDVPWGMVFRIAGPEPRDPSQLYELALEGVALFLILWIHSSKPRPVGSVSALFLIYGVFRSIVELVREPDDYVDVLGVTITMGQALSLPMLAVGIALWVWSHRQVAAAQQTR